VSHINLRESITGHDYPGLWKLSKAEWIRYVIEHGLRHLRQIENSTR
jgi:hypothetical protein